MTPVEHKAQAERFAAAAAKVYATVTEITAAQGGLDPALHAALFREMTATAELAQAHAALAATPEGSTQTLAAIRQLVEGWDEERDGPDAADFFVRLRPLLGLENPA